jgi:hypothetical protein
LLDCLYLVNFGVPYDVAFGLDEAERMAYVVACGTLGDLSFNWHKLRWDDR